MKCSNCLLCQSLQCVTVMCCSWTTPQCLPCCNWSSYRRDDHCSHRHSAAACVHNTQPQQQSSWVPFTSTIILTIWIIKAVSHYLALTSCVCSPRTTWHAVWSVSICILSGYETSKEKSAVCCLLCVSKWHWNRFLSFCCVQAAQSVEGKHQLSRRWSGSRVRGRKRGYRWRQDELRSNTLSNLKQGYIWLGP